MSSPERVLIPEGLAAMAPGPELAAELAGIDPWALTAEDAVAVMTAWHRQVAHTQAGFFTAMTAFGLCRPAPPGTVAHDAGPSEGASDEVRAALTWTRRAAETQFYLGWDLHDRLPEVLAVLADGRIDLPRARVLSDWTMELEPEQAVRICLALLPQAGGLTTGELIDRVKQMAVAIDPDWAARRYRQAVRTRRVVGHRTPDGTANISGLDLPVDQAAAACAHIEQLARAVKRAGDDRPIDQVRADMFLGMLDGTFTGWDDQQIVTHFRDRHAETVQDHCAQTADPVQSGPGEPGPGEPGSSAAAPTSAGGGEPDTEQPDTGQPSAGQPSAGRPGASAAGGGSGPPDGSDGDTDRSPTNSTDRTDDGRGAGVPAGVELRVRLSTLLGLDRFPAEIAGWGPTHAENARALTASQTGGQWRYAVCDDHGGLLADGLITARPTGYPRRRKRPGAIVEIQIPATLLRHLYEHPDLHPEWAKVIDQITRDLDTQGGDTQGGDGQGGDTQGGDGQEGDGQGGDTQGGDTQGGDGQGGDGQDGAAQGDDAGRGDEQARPGARDRRFPARGLRRHIQTRDRRCGFRGCRMPASGTDTDHIRQWIGGGVTQDHNLTSLCRHDHRLKDHGGWALTGTADGALRWTSRLGLVYTVRRTPVIIHLPDPAPGTRVGGSLALPADDTPLWTESPEAADQRPAAEPEPEPEDRPPPSIIEDEPPPF